MSGAQLTARSSGKLTRYPRQRRSAPQKALLYDIISKSTSESYGDRLSSSRFSVPYQSNLSTETTLYSTGRPRVSSSLERLSARAPPSSNSSASAWPALTDPHFRRGASRLAHLHKHAQDRRVGLGDRSRLPCNCLRADCAANRLF